MGLKYNSPSQETNGQRERGRDFTGQHPGLSAPEHGRGAPLRRWDGMMLAHSLPTAGQGSWGQLLAPRPWVRHDPRARAGKVVRGAETHQRGAPPAGRHRGWESRSECALCSASRAAGCVDTGGSGQPRAPAGTSVIQQSRRAEGAGPVAASKEDGSQSSTSAPVSARTTVTQQQVTRVRRSGRPAREPRSSGDVSQGAEKR